MLRLFFTISQLYPSNIFTPEEEAMKMYPLTFCAICQLTPLPFVTVGPKVLTLGFGLAAVQKAIKKIRKGRNFFLKNFFRQKYTAVCGFFV